MINTILQLLESRNSISCYDVAHNLHTCGDGEVCNCTMYSIAEICTRLRALREAGYLTYRGASDYLYLTDKGREMMITLGYDPNI